MPENNEIVVASDALPAQFADMVKNDVAGDMTLKTGFTPNLVFGQGRMTLGETDLGQGPFYVYILAACRVNAWYSQPYQAGVAAIPDCYAMFMKEEEEAIAAPHEQSKMPQCEGCLNCPKNAWGSAGKPGSNAKACNNNWRLAMIPGGQFDANGRLIPFNGEGIMAQDIIQCKLAVTSGNSYKKYAKNTAITTNRPKYFYMTALTTVIHPKNQYEVMFTHVHNPTDVDVLQALLAKKIDAESHIIAPFQEPTTAAAPVQQAPVAPALQRF